MVKVLKRMDIAKEVSGPNFHSRYNYLPALHTTLEN